MFQGKKLNKGRRAFSMMETVIAIFVLSIGLLAIVALYARSVKNSMESRNQIIAASLAQEGLELARNIRDNNLAAGNPQAFNNFAENDAVCRVDYLSTKIATDGTECDKGRVIPDKRLYLKDNAYSHDNAGEPTRFQRKLVLIYNGSKSQLTVRSMVIWGSVFPTSYANCTSGKKCAAAQAILANN